jgi:hypothetical protein
MNIATIRKGLMPDLCQHWAGAGLTNADSFHVLDFALGSVSAALLLLVAAVVAHRVRRPRQPHAPMPISKEESSKDDEKAVLTQAV